MTKLLSWFKRFFQKKIVLPFWFIMLGRPCEYSKFEDYAKAIDKISEALLQDKTVIVMINGTPAKIWKENGKVQVRKLEKHEYRIGLGNDN